MIATLPVVNLTFITYTTMYHTSLLITDKKRTAAVVTLNVSNIF